ncbi:MAG: OsmC family protein [Saprospiraceae bacterium]|nr:OsmC family protein [Saprospiraceae bacterium]
MEHTMLFKLKAGLEPDGIASLHAPDVQEVVYSTTPPEFPGGKAGYWSPETMLLGATVGCFLNTFQVFAQKLKLPYESITCEATGTVDRVDGKFGFTGITLFPKLILSDEAAEQAAAGALDKAHRYCLISNSLSCPVVMEETILTAIAAV